MNTGAAQAVLMYFVPPVWLAAGFADYLCHRAASIETTSGWKESLILSMVLPYLEELLRGLRHERPKRDR